MQVTSINWSVGVRRWITSICSWFEWVGLVAILAIVLSALIDTIGSKLFNWPLPGSTELVTVMQIMAVASGLAFSEIDGRHIRVDLFVNMLHGRSKAALEIFDSLMGLGFFVIAAWMTFEYGISLFDNSTTTLILGIPYYPFALWIAFSCVPMCLVLLLELANLINRVVKL